MERELVAALAATAAAHAPDGRVKVWPPGPRHLAAQLL
jgi:hypothetical protein